jgi:hypothetical protein
MMQALGKLRSQLRSDGNQQPAPHWLASQQLNGQADEQEVSGRSQGMTHHGVAAAPFA